MELGLLGQTAGMFAVTNTDDMLVLAVFFGQAGDGPRRCGAGDRWPVPGVRRDPGRLGARCVGLLPGSVIPYLGLLPLLLGLRAAWKARREHRADDAPDERPEGDKGTGVMQIATVTFANGGDNIGVYVLCSPSPGSAA